MNAATVVQMAIRAIEKHDIQALSGLVANDFNFPLPGGLAQLHKDDYIGLMGTLVQAMPDLAFNVSHVEVQGNKVRLTTRWTGTQLGPLTLPGLSPFQPTGRRIVLPEPRRIYGNRRQYRRVHYSGRAWRRHSRPADTTRCHLSSSGIAATKKFLLYAGVC